MSLVTLLMFIVGIAMLFLFGGDRAVVARSCNLAKAAKALEGEFVEKPDARPFEFCKTLSCFAACNKHGKPTNLIRLKQGLELTSVDYVCWARNINSSTPFEQTIFGLPPFGDALPDFLLHPKTFLDKAVSLVTKKGMTVTTREDFNNEHLVEGRDKRIQALFTQQIVAGCAGQRGQILEAQNGRLIGYWNKQKTKPEKYADSAKFMLAIGKAIRAQLAGPAPAAAPKGAPAPATKPVATKPTAAAPATKPAAAAPAKPAAVAPAKPPGTRPPANPNRGV